MILPWGEGSSMSVISRWDSLDDSGHKLYGVIFQGHNVVVFTEDGVFVRRIGCENITNFPNGTDISGMFLVVLVLTYEILT